MSSRPSFEEMVAMASGDRRLTVRRKARRSEETDIPLPAGMRRRNGSEVIDALRTALGAESDTSLSRKLGQKRYWAGGIRMINNPGQEKIAGLCAGIGIDPVEIFFEKEKR